MSTEKPLTRATKTLRQLSLKRKILLVLITWGIIEEVVSWIFKARGIDIGPLGVISMLGAFISGF